MTFYYFRYAPPEAEEIPIVTGDEIREHPGGRTPPAAIPCRHPLLHDVKAIG